MNEHNLLTEKLLLEGFTKDSFPSYIHQYLEYSGGFVYKDFYVDSLIVKLPCGKVAKGSRFFREMSVGRVDYCFENNNPVFVCPFGRHCMKRSKAFRMDKDSLCFCHGTISDELYVYDHSIEKMERDADLKKQKSFDEFCTQHNGRVCIHQCSYDVLSNTWQQSYDPMKCIRNNCTFCALKGKEVGSQKGNIFYDLESTWTCRDGSLFDGEETVSVTKGIPFFERSHPLSILEDIVKLRSDEILRKVGLEKQYEMFMLPVVYRVLNIQAKKKVTRDLMADLEDVAAGKHIVHDSDQKRSEKEWKRKNKELREEKAKKRLINMLMDGIIPSDPFTADYKHMISWFTKEQIEEYIRMGEEKRKNKEEREKPEFVQLTFFD